MTKYIVSSGVTSAITLGNGDTMSVFGSGTSLHISVGYGGTELVSSGGVSDYSSVSKSGTEVVYSGGVASNTEVKDPHGHFIISAHGMAISSLVKSDGFMAVESGGYAFATVVSNSVVDVSSGGIESSGSIFSSLEYVSGTADNTVLSAGGAQYVYADAISNMTTILNGGKQFIEGSSLRPTTANSYGTEISAGGTQIVLSQGIASGTVVDSGGTENVYGVADVSMISNGGVEYLNSGGVSYGAKILSGGLLIAISAPAEHHPSTGGVASNTTIKGGTLEIASGGSATGHVTFAGKHGDLLIGTANMPTAKISGFQHGDEITLAAVPYNPANSVVVNAPGLVTISAGGATYNLAIAGATVAEADFKLVAGTSGTMLEKKQTPKMQFLRPQSAAPATAFLTRAAPHSLATSAAPYVKTTHGVIRETITRPDYTTPLILSASHG